MWHMLAVAYTLLSILLVNSGYPYRTGESWGDLEICQTKNVEKPGNSCHSALGTAAILPWPMSLQSSLSLEELKYRHHWKYPVNAEEYSLYGWISETHGYAHNKKGSDTGMPILLMGEILHQLIGTLSHYLQGFIHPRWCRISSINRRFAKNETFGGGYLNSPAQYGFRNDALKLHLFHWCWGHSSENPVIYCCTYNSGKHLSPQKVSRLKKKNTFSQQSQPKKSERMFWFTAAYIFWLPLCQLGGNSFQHQYFAKKKYRSYSFCWKDHRQGPDIWGATGTPGRNGLTAMKAQIHEELFAQICLRCLKRVKHILPQIMV